MPEEERWRAKPRRRYRPTRRVELIEILKRDAVPALSVRLAVRHVSLLDGRGYHGPSAPRCCGGLPVEAAGTSKLNPSVRGDLASLHRRPGRCIIVARNRNPDGAPLRVRLERTGRVGAQAVHAAGAEGVLPVLLGGTRRRQMRALRPVPDDPAAAPSSPSDRDVPSLSGAKGPVGAHDLRQVPGKAAGLERSAPGTVRP